MLKKIKSIGIVKILLLLVMSFSLFSCGEAAEPADIINPDADYVYFYGKTCPHCIELNKYMKENDTMSKYAIEKREVWNNKENSALFQAVTVKLGLEEGTVGVPFLLEKSTSKYYIGGDDIKEILK